jgi:branched-chain amino acid transport system substrate-binding protein
MTPDGNAALAYDATMVIAAAVQRPGTSRRQARDYLAGLASRGGYAGVTGTLSFGENGDPVGKAIVMTRIRHGALVPEVTR